VGDAEKQRTFAKEMGGGLRHLQMNHNAERSETGDAVLAARAISHLSRIWRSGRDDAESDITTGSSSDALCMRERVHLDQSAADGNAPRQSQHKDHASRHSSAVAPSNCFDEAGLRVRLENPYQLKTKGEMLLDCADQKALARSCRRYDELRSIPYTWPYALWPLCTVPRPPCGFPRRRDG
jgi:hypothetical protein